MSVCYQPKYDLRRGCVSGAEVLARWTHATRGPIAPDLFIRMAEETGGIAPLTLWVMRQTLACQQRLVAAGNDATLAVNLSGRLIDDPMFIDAALELVRAAPGQLY